MGRVARRFAPGYAILDAVKNIADTTVLQRAKAVKFDRLDDEFLGIDAKGGMCYSLNPTAHQLWAFLEKPISFGELCARLAEFYQTDEATVRADVPDALADLQSEGLIAIADA